MVTAPSNLWGRVCKCVFLSSDLQIVPFIAFVTVKIKVPGWPAPQITESAQGAAAGWEPTEGSEPCYLLCACVCVCACAHTHTNVHTYKLTPICAVDLCPGVGRCALMESFSADGPIYSTVCDLFLFQAVCQDHSAHSRVASLSSLISLVSFIRQEGKLFASHIFQNIPLDLWLYQSLDPILGTL